MYAFEGGVSGTSVTDETVFVEGNTIICSGNNNALLTYSNDKILDTDYMGPSSRYFTRKYDEGLFVMAADTNGMEWIRAVSEFGNSEGEIAAESYSYKGYTGYLLKVFGNEKNGVNKWIIF